MNPSKAVNPAVHTSSAAASDATWKAYIEAGVRKANATAVSNAAKIQKFAIVPEFSLVSGELTPTLKLKRQVVLARYAAIIDSLYVGDE